MVNVKDKFTPGVRVTDGRIFGTVESMPHIRNSVLWSDRKITAVLVKWDPFSGLCPENVKGIMPA